MQNYSPENIPETPNWVHTLPLPKSEAAVGRRGLLVILVSVSGGVWRTVPPAL